MTAGPHPPSPGPERREAPDPALWASRPDPHRAATRRILLVATLLLMGVAGGAFILRYAARVVSAARSATPDLAAGLALPVPEAARPAEKPPVSPEQLAELQRSWVGSESIAPRNDRVDPATGERVGTFQGFGLQIDTDPAGARVLVNGEEMGTSPLLTTVDCEPGEDVEVLAERAGLRARARTRCRADALVKLRLGLTRAPKR